MFVNQCDKVFMICFLCVDFRYYFTVATKRVSFTQRGQTQTSATGQLVLEINFQSGWETILKLANCGSQSQFQGHQVAQNGLTNRRLVDSCWFCSFSVGGGRRTLRRYRIYSNLTNQVQYILNIKTEHLFALLQTSSTMYRGFYLNSVPSHDVD